MHAANNPKVNAISSIAYALVGGESAFYALEADRRQVNRDIARRLYEAGLTVGSAEANNKRVVEGFVYIVTNPAFPGWIKIGCAMNMPSRIEAFNTGDPQRAYHVEYKVYNSHRERAERVVFTRLQHYRGKGEWFNCSIGYAKAALQEVAEAPA